MAVADHQESNYDFASSDAKDMVADRQREWASFTRLITWSIVATVAVLLLLLVFVV